VYNICKSILPSLSKSIDVVHGIIHLMDIKSNHFEQFVLSNKNTHVIIFSFIKIFKFFCSNEKVLLDSTFNYCTKYFLQLFTIKNQESK
jgi:hypothetical protein